MNATKIQVLNISNDKTQLIRLEYKLMITKEQKATGNGSNY